jgi:hypothetical protein
MATDARCVVDARLAVEIILIILFFYLALLQALSSLGIEVPQNLIQFVIADADKDGNCPIPSLSIQTDELTPPESIQYF